MIFFLTFLLLFPCCNHQAFIPLFIFFFLHSSLFFSIPKHPPASQNLFFMIFKNYSFILPFLPNKKKILSLPNFIFLQHDRICNLFPGLFLNFTFLYQMINKRSGRSFGPEKSYLKS